MIGSLSSEAERLREDVQLDISLKIHKFGSSQRRSKLLLESVRESMTVASIVRFTYPVVNIHCLYSSHALVKGEVGMLHCLAFHEGII